MLKYIVFLILPLITCGAHADDFSNALANVRNNCANLSDKMEHIKTMAGINTAVTGVGTATAAGATAVGIAKSRTDAQLAQILTKIRNSSTSRTSYQNPPKQTISQLLATANGANQTAVKLNDKSKQLGHARTGLLGASTATNVAGAVISSKNTVDEEFQAQVDDCVNSIRILERATGQARMDGVDVKQAQKIISACGRWKDVDLSKINTKAKAAMISSIVGAGTGAAGTITSAVANTDSVRTGDAKDKNLNIASNVLAGGTTIASGVATVFNATQISAAKKIVAVAQECEEALK